MKHFHLREGRGTSGLTFRGAGHGGRVAVLELEEHLRRRDARPHLGQRGITAGRGKRRGLTASPCEEETVNALKAILQGDTAGL